MTSSNSVIISLHPNIQAMPDPPDLPVTSNEADFIQCERDIATGKVTRILVSSKTRPPTALGSRQDQHSSAYTLLLAYAKKEAADIVKIVESGDDVEKN